MDAVSYSKASSAYKLAGQAIVGLTTKADLTTSGILVPVGATAARPTLGAGEAAIRYNTDVGGLEEWNGTAWKNVSADITAVAIKGTDTVANILAKTGMVAEDLWIASDTLDGYVYDGSSWINIGPLRGPQGIQGIQGVQGEQGTSITSIVRTNGTGAAGTTDTYTVTMSDASTGTFTVYNGSNGIDGNGITSVTRTSGTGLAGSTDTYTITYTDATTSTFTVYNGVNGTINHIAKTGTVGTTDTYTAYADAAKTQPLGSFEVYNGIDGRAITTVTFTSTTDASGLPAQAGGTDTYTISYSDATTSTYNIYNGADGTNVSVIDDTTITTTNTWSASKINSMLGSMGGMGVSQIVTPTITTPTTGAIDFTGAVTATYTTSASYVGVQDWVRWEAGNSDFSVIYDSYEGASNLLSWTPSVGLAPTVVYMRVKQGSDGHRSGWSPTVSFTTPNLYIETPTLTVTGTPTDVPETPTLTTSVFSVFNGTDTHASTDWYVKQGGTTVWSSVADTVNKLSITVPAGVLSVSTAYTFEAYHTGATYGNSGTVSVSGTTKSAFAPEQGQKGFGIEPMQAGAPYAVFGLAEMDGTNTVGHDNYGNYIHTNGSIVCHYPKKYYRVGHPDAPQYATYGANSLEMVPLNAFANEAEANAAGWVLHRTFIDGGTEQNGFVRFKYLASKSATDANKAVSVKNGNPIGLTTTASYNPSSTMTGCVGQLHDAVTLSRAIGAGWNNESVFMVGWSAMISIAQAQRATSTDDVAWYDATGVMNFPKGCNNGSRADVNDTSVTWSASPNDAAKGLTGSASNFAKSTDNGANNGCADVNGLMYQVALGMTNYGTSATATTQITTNTIYVLKKTAYLKDLTAGWDGATDAWGNTTNLATRYDAVTSPITISAALDHKWGSGANQVLSPNTTGVAHDLCGFLPKNDAAADATGASQFGTDRMYKYNRMNMYPYTAGYWSASANAGVFCRYLGYYRSSGDVNGGFRAAAYIS